MPLYEVTLRQRYFSQDIVNVFGYFVPPVLAAAPNALELLSLMGFIASGDPLEFGAGSIAESLQSIQNAGVEFISAEARELYSFADFYEAVYDPPLVGTFSGGDAVAPFVAYGLFSARIRLDIKRAQKRFVGVSEGQMSAGGTIGSSMLGFLADLGDLMSVVLAGAAADYNPCVISREKVIDPDTGAVTYQLYDTEAEQEEHIAYPLVWSPHTTVRSQTSRQYGRGS